MVKPKGSHPPTRLSEDLRRILKQADGKGVTVGQIIEILHGRGFDVLIILLTLPFCTPIPLPGLSTPFGLILMFFGLRIALRQRPWLPRRLLNMEIPYPTLTKLIKGALAVATRLEKILHPRLRFFKDWPSFNFLNGMSILISAFVLSLPLPIPFTNTLPAWSILLIAAGMMENDGAVIIAGYLMAGMTWLYLASLVWVGKAGLTWMGF
ncbi:MAG: exopolysaccharide biosynthesis protein [Candidatus Manganitrophaceae bacterium]|nr:MAG: exopolysaccharide biosynthesis protein [Candidatus Manganitrophaceae bacterium]